MKERIPKREMSGKLEIRAFNWNFTTCENDYEDNYSTSLFLYLNRGFSMYSRRVFIGMTNIQKYLHSIHTRFHFFFFHRNRNHRVISSENGIA